MTKMRPLVAGVAMFAAMGSALVSGSALADTVKIAFIDPLSGLMAPVGQNQLKSWQFVADVANQKGWAGAHKFEVVGFDNKLSPQESLTILKQAIDQNIRYIVQGNGSSVGLALQDAVAKHNERNPGKEIVYLNYAAVDPDMTNAKCNYWHFRLDANSDMKMEAITGNWGSDLALLIKAGKDAGLATNYYTYYAGTTGVPTAMGAAGAEHVKYVGYYNPNNKGFKGADVIEGFKKKYNDDFYVMASYTGIAMLSKAFKDANSTDPVKVAKALEGIKVESMNGLVEMRNTDHQAQQPLVVATWTRIDGKEIKYDQENTGYGWKTNAQMDQYVSAQPTSCQMKRPG
ncbi:Periplasmic binding protein [compost metagenome]